MHAMPPDAYDILLSEIRGLRTDVTTLRAENRQDVQLLHAKVDAVAANGCARRPEADRRIEAVERATVANTRYIDRQAGQVAMIGGVAGLVTTVLVAIGRAMLTRIGGHGG
jgi:hypothetical protein